MKKSILFAATFLLGLLAAFGQDEPKFTIAPTGRILMDGGVFVSPEQDLRHDGVGIPDARLGVKMGYGKWSAKIDVGFANAKVGLKDLFIQYTFDDQNFIKAGNFIHQYGLQSATSSSNKVTMEEPISNGILNDDRQLGAMFEHADNLLLATVSVNADKNAGVSKLLLNDGNVKEGFGARSRIAVHPICEEGKVVQFGISGAFGLPSTTETKGDFHKSFSFSANLPTRLFSAPALDATVSDARNLWKFTPELLLAYGPVALESQYYFMQVNRQKDSGLQPYRAYGAYGIVRGLLIGGDYKYATKDGGLANPGKGSLELVGMYNYTCMSDSKADIFGGRTSGCSFTLNYYINKYMTARLHYSYTHSWGNHIGPQDLNAIMARLQVIF